MKTLPQRYIMMGCLGHFKTVPVPHVDEGEDAVKSGHEDVRHGQVQQEVVGHAPHAAVC